MRKLILSMLLLVSLTLSACGRSAGTSQPTLEAFTPTAQSTLEEPAPTSQPTIEAPSATTVLEVPQSSSLAGPDSGCTLISRQPTPGPTQLSLFPPVTEADHVKGAETAKVTIIEYSDFQ